MNRSSRTKKNKEKTKNKIVATILILIGLAFIAYGFKDSIKSRLLRGDVEDEVTQQIDYSINKTEDRPSETNWVYPTEDYEPVEDRVENHNEYASIGAFIVPKIDQTIALMDGFGGNNMYRGAGTHYLDMQMGRGNYVLSSHRMYDGMLFGRLEEVEVGDEVYLTDYERVYKYEVIDSDNRVNTSQTKWLKDTAYPILTFYGCTADGVMRVVKQAKLIGYSNIEDLGEEDAKLLSNTK